MTLRVGLVHALLGLMGLALWVGRGVDLGAVDLQAVQVVGALAVVVMLAQTVSTRTAPLQSLQPTTQKLLAGVAVAVTAIVAVAALSAFQATDPISVLRFVVRYVLGLVLVVALVQFLGRRSRLRQLERALLFGAVASVGLAALGFVLPELGAITIRYGDRAQALLNHPNQFAILLTAVAPIALAAALRQPRRPTRWAVLLVVAAGVAFTGSKLNLALLVVALPAMGLLATLLRRGMLERAASALRLMGLAAAALAVAYAVVLRFNPRTLATFERLLEDPWSTSAVVTRSEMWGTALRVGLDHPWFGVGADHAGSYLPHSHAHNVVLEFFLTMGAGGLVALGLLLLAWLSLVSLSVWLAFTRRAMPFADRLALLAYSSSLTLYLASNQSSDSFGGTTLPIAWIATAMALGQVEVVLRDSASARATAAAGAPEQPAPGPVPTTGAAHL